MFYYPVPLYLIRYIRRGGIYRQIGHNKPSKDVESFLLLEFHIPIIRELPVNNLPILIIIIDSDFTDLHICYSKVQKDY